MAVCAHRAGFWAAAGAGAATPLGSVGATSTDPTPGGKCLKHREYAFGKVLRNSIISLNCIS